jgi:hypothetical protein
MASFGSEATTRTVLPSTTESKVDYNAVCDLAGDHAEGVIEVNHCDPRDSSRAWASARRGRGSAFVINIARDPAWGRHFGSFAVAEENRSAAYVVLSDHGLSEDRAYHEIGG